MERVTTMEKDIEYMRGVVTRLFTSVSEEKIETEKKMTTHEKNIQKREAVK